MTEGKMSLMGHLSELRKRLMVSVIAVVIGFGFAFNFSEDIMKFLMFPMQKDMVLKPTYPFISFIQRTEGNAQLVFLAPAEAFWMHLKVSFVAGLFFSAPVIMYQLWRFISPGLLPKEKRYTAPFVIAATALFFIGSAFCFAVVLPFAMKFLMTYKTASLVPMISIGNYVDFCLKFILAFGVVFELPVAIVILTRMGVVSTAALAKHRKYAVLLAFIAAAVLTPTPDAFNQTLMAVPIMLLYEVGLLASRLFKKRQP